MAAEPSTKSSRRRGITFITNPLLSIILSVLLTIALRLLIESTWPYLPGLWNVWWFRTIGTFIVALIGGGLFLFRKYHQVAYGLSEIGFALTVCWISIGRAQTAQDAASWIAVVAAAYFVVRGLTNYEEGKKKRVAENEF